MKQLISTPGGQILLASILIILGSWVGSNWNSWMSKSKNAPLTESERIKCPKCGSNPGYDANGNWNPRCCPEGLL